MNIDTLKATVAKLVEKPKGILAIDESTETCTKRFEKLGVPSNEDTRREYRELLITAPEIEKYISGMIMVEETLKQSTHEGKTFKDIFSEKGILMGIKVDKGTHDMTLSTGDKITEGLDGLKERLVEYKNLGATFAKWRAVFQITDTTPSEATISENAHALARYAALCQEADIVPIVEPEVLMDGNHSIETTYEVIAKILDALFHALVAEGVALEGVILKTGMVIEGVNAERKADAQEIAEKTLALLRTHVPPMIGGIVFLSGGQGEEEATLNLNAMHKTELPWPLTFSYGRAIQNPALTTWAKDRSHFTEAQRLLVERAQANSEASIGKYHK
jgi:fructose-bisphosphate aldolase class I